MSEERDRRTRRERNSARYMVLCVFAGTVLGVAGAVLMNSLVPAVAGPIAGVAVGMTLDHWLTRMR